MNARKWIKTIGAPDMIAEQYDIAYAGGELPKDRPTISVAAYADSGKKFDPCEMRRSGSRRSGRHCVNFTTASFGTIYVRSCIRICIGEQNGCETGIKKQKNERGDAGEMVGQCKPCCYAARARSTRARTGCAASAAE